MNEFKRLILILVGVAIILHIGAFSVSVVATTSMGFTELNSGTFFNILSIESLALSSFLFFIAIYSSVMLGVPKKEYQKLISLFVTVGIASISVGDFVGDVTQIILAVLNRYSFAQAMQISWFISGIFASAFIAYALSRMEKQ